MTAKNFSYLPLFFLLLVSCRGTMLAVDEEIENITTGDKNAEITGFYLLNEGNMGSNKSTLDFFDYTSGDYHLNIFGERNPSVAHELGDVGNDIAIYGSRLYAVINNSNLVEVMNASNATHIGAVSIPNCRYVAFEGRFAYVSSYAGAIELGGIKRLGYVAKVDTATLEIIATCEVGYQPEQIAIAGGKLYVANSGGYNKPHYDNRLSVINLDNFKLHKHIEVGENLHKIEPDNYGNLYISSRGDYDKFRSKTYVFDPKTEQIDTLNLLSNSNMTLSGDSLYVISYEHNEITGANATSYAIYDTKLREVVTRSFIKNGLEKDIKVPYALAVNPSSGEVLISDAKSYDIPGTLYCFDKNGNKLWQQVAGDIPAHIVFTKKNK